MLYTLHKTYTATDEYLVEAESEEEAKELVLEAKVFPADTVAYEMTRLEIIPP